MLPESLLKYKSGQGFIEPILFDESDYPWLRHLIVEYHRFVGLPRRELQKHFKEPLGFASPKDKRMIALRVLDTMFETETKSPVNPKLIRATLFELAALNPFDLKQVLSEASQKLSLQPGVIEKNLFSDLPPQKKIASPKEEIFPDKLALFGNSLIFQSFLARALNVEIEFRGNARAVIRQAKLLGLICEVSCIDRGGGMSAEGNETRGCLLKISGPYAILKRTLYYGRALASLVPVLAWCNDFSLRARCLIHENECLLILCSGDPIRPSKMPRMYDSLIEEHFARKFLRLTQEWDLIREPEPIKTGDKLIFPDFMAKNRQNPDLTWWIEIIGFWTPDYLQRKINDLKLAGIKNLILCISDRLNCSEEDFPKEAHCIMFSKKVDPNKVLAIMEQNHIPRPPRTID